MLHIPPLPGAPRYEGNWKSIRLRVLDDTAALVEGGVDGLMLENFGDAPFYRDRVPPHVVACMTRIAREVRQRFDVPLGISVLRNDGCAALAIAHAIKGAFIRVNVLCSARVTDQGITQGIAHELLRQRALLGATEVRILADVNVKHSAPFGSPRPLRSEVADLVERGGADAVIVSGEGTGEATDLVELARVKEVAGEAPVLVGSGVTVDTIRALLTYADGAIVGTSLKVDGLVRNPVDPKRVKGLIAAAW
jgi:membrane complex biogenesis BtpA family protein